MSSDDSEWKCYIYDSNEKWETKEEMLKKALLSDKAYEMNERMDRWMNEYQSLSTKFEGVIFFRSLRFSYERIENGRVPSMQWDFWRWQWTKIYPLMSTASWWLSSSLYQPKKSLPSNSFTALWQMSSLCLYIYIWANSFLCVVRCSSTSRKTLFYEQLFVPSQMWILKCVFSIFFVVVPSQNLYK